MIKTESGNKRDSFLNDKYRWKWFTRYEDWRRTILSKKLTR